MTIVHEKGFIPTLFQSVDEAISSVLGRETTSTLYYAIQMRYDLSDEKFRQKPLDLIQHLQEILGESGFQTIEGSIRSNIKKEFDVKGPEDQLDFPELVELAKRNYLLSEL
ncbi:MAG: hypothetical protein JRN20_09625 [Nitrososphaerota archaeon]|nr:hypothetical protein [Nitrososphaerota archaeon]MDG6923324.1 hypothetical protein [Nitrososphaerota archaeon]